MFSQLVCVARRVAYGRVKLLLVGALSFWGCSTSVASSATTDEALFTLGSSLVANPCAEACELGSFSVSSLGSRRVVFAADERFEASEVDLYLVRSNDANCEEAPPKCEAAIVVTEGHIWRFLADASESYDYLNQVRLIEPGRFLELKNAEAAVTSLDLAAPSVQPEKLCQARGMSLVANQISELLAAGTATLTAGNGGEIARISEKVIQWPDRKLNGQITEIAAGTICASGAPGETECLRIYRCQSGEGGFVLTDEAGVDVALLQTATRSDLATAAQGTSAVNATEEPRGVKQIRGFTNQGIVFTLWVETQRREDGVLVRLIDAEARHNPAATFNAVRAQEAFAMSLYVVTRKNCTNCRPGFVQESSAAWRFSDGNLQESSPALEVFVPDHALYGADEMNFSFLARTADLGILFMSPDGIPTHTLLGGNTSSTRSTAVASDGTPSDEVTAIAQELLADYDNDMERINKVADHADMAILAWAAYGTPEALSAASERGWTAIESVVNNNLFGGDTAAIRFASDDGRQVLAFRGSKTAGDWHTNVAGTLVSSPITTAQISGAIEIALDMARQFPDIVFVGHSLGGRLAQISRLRTGNKAVVFNSAPLNILENEKVGVKALMDALLRRESPKNSVLFFRNIKDALSHFTVREQIEVPNVFLAEKAEGFGRLNPKSFIMRQEEFYHSMSMLAGAMQQVRIARDEGWFNVYLSGQGNSDDTPSQSIPAVWPATMRPQLQVPPGQRRDGLSVGVTGDVTFRGTPVFPVVKAYEGITVDVYRSPLSEHMVVIQRDRDWGGLRAAVLFDGEPSAFVASAAPDSMVLGKGAVGNVVLFHDGVSWSPDGRYVALQASRKEAEVSLLLIDITTGQGTLVHPDEGGRIAAVAIDELRYSDNQSKDQLSATFQNRECADPNCEMLTRTNKTTISFDISGTIRSNPWPTVRRVQAVAADAQEWGPDIVAPSGFTVDQWLSCEKQDQINCLRSAGFSEMALNFIASNAERFAGGFPRSFRELGQVDLLELELLHGPWQASAFVNGVPGEIPVSVPGSALPETYSDASSRNILVGVDPMGGDWGNIKVVSHRILPNQGQRFVATSTVTSGCRACPVIGIAVRQFDFDAQGNLLHEKMIGLMDWRGRELTREYQAASVLQDVALAQFLLNVRGYDAGPMDGAIGPQSRIALASFQEEHCLARTGRLDPASAEALATNDFFSSPCEKTARPVSTAQAETVTVTTEASASDAKADCSSIESDTARLQCYDAASGGSQNSNVTTGPLSRDGAAQLIATSAAANEKRSKVYMTSRFWAEATQRDLFRPNGSWELFPSPGIAADVAGGLPGGKILELTREAAARVSLVVEVTGIVPIGDYAARVEFQWRYQGLPAWMGEGARPAAPSRAELRRYDDGWRVVQADFPIGNDECTAEQNAINSEGWGFFLGGGC